MAVRILASVKLIFGSLLRKMVFITLRLVYIVFQSIWWRLSGTGAQVEANKQPDNYNKCAQVLRIVTYSKFDFLLPPSLRDFMLTHEEFVDPRYVVEHDHVSMFFIDPHQDVAVFGEGLEGQMLWKAEFNSFITTSLFMHAKRLIVMPMTAFHKLCATLPEPKGRLILMGNTGRCGSTLMCQLFESTRKVITYSEPSPFINIGVLHRKKGDCEELRQLIRNVVRMYCRPLKSLPDPAGYLIKPSGPALVCMEPVQAMYPDVRLFYLYRDMTKVTLSMYKLSFILPLVRVAYLVFRVSGSSVYKIYESYGFPTKGTNRTLEDDFSSGVFQAVVAASMFTYMRERGAKIHALLFDDLIKDKEQGTRAILKVSGLPLTLAQDALRAFKNDAQKNSIVSQDAFSKIPALEYTEEDRVRASKVMLEFGYPPLDQPCRLDGTLDFQAVLASD